MQQSNLLQLIGLEVNNDAAMKTAQLSESDPIVILPQGGQILIRRLPYPTWVEVNGDKRSLGASSAPRILSFPTGPVSFLLGKDRNAEVSAGDSELEYVDLQALPIPKIKPPS